jgi:hypothetical protein
VLPKPNRVCEKHWEQWRQFLKSEVDEDDPYLESMTEDETSALVCLMMHRRHQAGHRGKAATAYTAGIRRSFACRFMGTAFLDTVVEGTARAACLVKPDELRQRRDSGESCSVKLPMCHSVLVDMKRVELKDSCRTRNYLPPDYFSAHSLRKGAHARPGCH